MKHKKSKNKIKCDVINCIYNDMEGGDCSLPRVKISSRTDRGSAYDSSSTICQSFEKSSGIITDNEYEIGCEIDSDENVTKL